MGAYRSKPITTTFPIDDKSTKLSYGASSMQGWRMTQEDAHFCHLNFDTNTSLFGVFDGHGGAEVAQYTAEHLPNFLKQLSAYKNGEFEAALKDAFVEFDKTLIEESVLQKLKELAGLDSDDDEDKDNDLKALKEEAQVPVESLLQKYIAEKVAGKERKAKLRAQQSIHDELSGSEDSSSPITCKAGSSKQDTDAEASSSCSKTNGSKSDGTSSIVSELQEKEAPANGSANESQAGSSSSPKDEKAQALSVAFDSNGDEQEAQNMVSSASSEIEAESASSKALEGASSSSSSNLGKGRKQSRPVSLSSSELRAPTVLDLYTKDFSSDDNDSEESEEESDDDETEDSEDEEASDEDDEEGDEEDEEEGDDDEDGEDAIPFGSAFMPTGPETPGKDSGCTAVVALLNNDNLWVANAGDSRCVLSRAGKAVEMSFDHKPESEEEFNRIKKAGGFVSPEGRVNGGLNLSRAIGDHSYKEKKDLDMREQMITALPDVKHEKILPEDEFLIIACDGIWNSMTSQEAIDFVRKRMKTESKLSAICDELFYNCLSPDSMGDGTGCDNMTCVIVKFTEPIQNGSSEQDKTANGGHKRPIEECESGSSGESSINKKICNRVDDE